MASVCRSVFMVGGEPVVLPTMLLGSDDAPGRSVDAGIVGLASEPGDRLPDETGDRPAQRPHRPVGSRAGFPSLTSRQEMVLELCARGMTYREIGAQLYISESTVRFHIQVLKKKLEVGSKAQLIALAVGSRLITMN